MLFSSRPRSYKDFHGHTVRRCYWASYNDDKTKSTETELRRCPPKVDRPSHTWQPFPEGDNDTDNNAVEDIAVTAVDAFLQTSLSRFREQASFTWRDIRIDSNSDDEDEDSDDDDDGDNNSNSGSNEEDSNSDDDEDNDSMCKDNSRADKWLAVEQALQRHAVSVKREFVLKDDLLVTHYDVPIVGHYQLVDPSAKERERERAGYREVRVGGFPRHWLQWKGRHYDPALIYEQVGGRGEEASSLRAVCPVMRVQALQRVFAKRNEERDSREEEEESSKLSLLCRSVYSASQLKRKAKKRNNNKNKKNSKRRIAGTASRKYLEFDLRGLSNVQAIGTMGGYPQKTFTFPPNHKKLDRARVEVLPSDEAAQQWVKSFSLQFRDERDGKWRTYSDPSMSSSIFVANDDIGTEVLHRVVLHARYLRITPLEAHNGKEMRVNVYGVHLAAEEDTTPIQEHDGEEGERVAQTVRYSLYPPRYREFTLSKRSYGCNCSYCCPQEQKIKEAREFISKEIKQSLKFMKEDDSIFED